MTKFGRNPKYDHDRIKKNEKTIGQMKESQILQCVS